MHRQLLCLLLLLAAPQQGSTVKIGVSKTETLPTTSPKPTTIEPTLAPTAPEEVTEATVLASTTPPPTTTFRSFAVPTFPPKITTASTTSTAKSVPPTTATSDATQKASTVPTEAAPESSSNETQSSVVPWFHYCSCDLLPQSCDINCCCDPDCPSEAIGVFDCFAAPKHKEHHTQLNDFQHGLHSCKVNDGWLCVFRTNTKPEKPHESIINLDTSKSYKWPNVLIGGSGEAPAERDSYKYGQPIKLQNRATLNIEDFALPFAFKPPFCHVDMPIGHLKPFSSSCLVSTLDQLQENRQKLLQLAATSRLLPQPRSRQPAADVPMQLRRCLATTDGCSELPSDSLIANASEAESWENTYATEIVVQLRHNYSHILSGLIEFRERELNASGEASEEIGDHAIEYWQHFEVQFIDANFSTAEELAVSGPLGYLRGKPVIVSSYIASSNNRLDAVTPANRVLDYFHENATRTRRKHSLRLFSQRGEVCHSDRSQSHPIAYGISELKQCTLHVANESLEPAGDRANHTAICVRLQQLAWQQLFDTALGTDTPPSSSGALYVSQLGRPQNRSDRWTPLQVSNYDFAPIVGEFNAAARSFVCRNMLLSAAYEFHIGPAHVNEVDGMPRQDVIAAALLRFGQRNDLEFALDEAIEVPLSITVMFYDYGTNGAIGDGSSPSPIVVPHSVLLYCVLGILIIVPSV